jgi:MFS family permease
MFEPSHAAVRPASAEPLGVSVALAAILVQAPRLVLAVLAADRQPVSAAAERVLLVVAGVGTALVLTGGNLYLAHSIARVRRWRRTLAAVWLAVLASSGGLVVPLVAAGLSGRTLPQLLGGEPLAWGWSLLAALAHEVTAAGCVLAAAAAAGERTAAERSHAREVEELLRQRDAARRELAALRPERAASERQAAGSGAGQRAERQGAGSGAGAGSQAERLACPEGCGRRFGSAPAVAGHLRHCAARSARLRQLALAAGGEPR